MFKITFIFALFFSTITWANTSVKIGPALKNKDGQIIFYAAQTHAIQACRELEKRLPTAREYAELSTTRGSEGILEINESPIPSRFYEVNVVNVDRSADHFYFSDKGYVEPNSEELKGHYDACYWTASAEQQVPNLFGHIFNPTFGFVRLFDRPYNFGACAIRCIAD